MGILGDAIAAYAQVGSGQVSPQAAVDAMGLTPDENKMMVNLLEMQRLSLRDSGTLSSDLNSAQSRERMSLLDAQVTFHNNLQGHLESIQGLNADNWNQAQDRVIELQKSINHRDAELAKIPNNINQAAIQNMRRSTTGINGQWKAITGFLGTDGQGLTDGQLYATLERFRASENQDFLPENWQTKPWPEIEEHLTQQNVDVSLISRIRNAVDRAQGTHTQLEIARQSVEDTQTALDAIDTDPSAFDPTSTQAQINNLQANINNMLLQGDPTTGLNAQSAIQEQGLMQQSIDLLAEQVAYRDRLAAASPEQQSSLNRGLGALVTKPQFQQWAKDNGYRVGAEVGGQYVPGRQDQLAVLAFRQEFLRGMHEYGLSGGRTGEILEIPVPGQEQKYSVDGEMLTRSEIEERYPNRDITVTDSGQIRVGLPEVFGDEDPSETVTPSADGLPTAMPDRVRLFDAAPLETIQVERARANAARILDDPNKIEVFIDGEIQIIDPDVVIRTVDAPEGADEAPEQISRRGIISRIKGLLENQGLLSQDTQLDETDTALVAEAAPAEVAPAEPARALRLPNGRSIYQRANGDFVTPGGRVISQTQDDGSPNPQWAQLQDQTGQASWEDVPEQEVSQFVAFADEVRATETPTLTERDQFELPGVPSDTPTLTRAPARTVTLPNGSVVTQRANGDFVLPGGGVISLRQEDGKSPNPNWIRLNNQLEGSPWEGEDPFSAQGIDFPFSDQEMATMTTVLDTDLPEPGEPDGLPGDTELQPASRECTAPWGDGEVVYTQNEAGDITYTNPDTGETKTVTAESNPSAHSAILSQKDLIRRRRAEYVDSQRSIETDPKTRISEEYRPSPLEVLPVEPEPLEIEEPVSTPRPEVPNLTPLRDIPKPLEVPTVEPEPLEMASGEPTAVVPTEMASPTDDRQPQRRLMGMFNRETPLFQNLRNRRDKKNGK